MSVSFSRRSCLERRPWTALSAHSRCCTGSVEFRARRMSFTFNVIGRMAPGASARIRAVGLVKIALRALWRRPKTDFRPRSRR